MAWWQSLLEAETGKKGYVSLMLLVAQLERAHGRLKQTPVNKSNHRRSSNLDLMLFRNSIERVSSFI